MRKYVDGPDGGWGWIVCLGTFIVAFIVEGTTAAFGVLIIPIQEEFLSSKSSTTWVASVSFGVCYLIGPVIGMLLERYSLRQVTIAGSLIGFCGFFAAAFSPNIIVLIVTYGIIGGIGMGVTFMTAIVAVGRYFNNKRAIATGIALSGAGFGMFAYPYLTELALRKFDWRGTVILMAAIYLNCAVSGTIFRPISFIDPSNSEFSDPDEKKSFVVLNPPFKRLTENGVVYSSLPHINVNYAVGDYDVQKSSSLECVKSENSERFSKIGLHRALLYHSGFMPISCEQIGSYKQLPVSVTDEKGQSCVSKYGENFKVLKHPPFILVLLIMVCWSVQYICTIYIPDFASSRGVPGAESALLVSFIGVTNTVGRIVTGFIVDFLHIRSITLYLCAFVIITIATFLLPLCSSFWMIALYSSIAGFCVGTFTGMRTIVIVDFVGIDFLSYAFGWTSFFQGVSSVPVPPLAGFIYDISGSYLNTFLLVAGYYTCGVVTCSILRFCFNRKQESYQVSSSEI